MCYERSRRCGLSGRSFSFTAMAQGAPPNFAPDASIGWYAYNRQFIPPASGPGPVQQDRARPYVTNDEFRVTGRQPTEQLADLSSPILQPWARDVVRKRNELVLSGKPANPPHASCWPVGVPGFLLRPMTQAMYFVQTPKVVVMILSSKQEVRHIDMTDKHSVEVKPSWYGEFHRPLRRRCAGRRHRRNRRADLGRRFRNAAH